MTSLTFCGKAIAQRLKRAKRWTIVKTPETNRTIRVFNAQCLIECVIKIGFAYLNFYGTDAQCFLPSWQKALWVVSYLEKRFEKKVRELRKDMVSWAAKKIFDVLRFKFKFLRARTFELVRARSRLYRSQMLQVNIRWKALAEIYTMHSFALLFNLKISAKNLQHFFAIEY